MASRAGAEKVMRRLAAATTPAAATVAAPTTVATTLALFRFRVRPVIFPATLTSATSEQEVIPGSR